MVRLAALSPLEYDREREAAADELGVRKKTLDDAVTKARAPGDGDSKQQGKAIEVPEAEPWEEEVDGAELLDEIVAIIHRHIVLPERAADGVALWVMTTYTLDAAQFAPRLWVWSPTRRCGKTTLLMIVNRLVHRALPGSNISPSSLFRTIEAAAPTLVIDEVDAIVVSDEMRGLLNSGHSRDMAFVIRTVGDEHEPRQFSTFAMIAIATKGKKLPDTIVDRSIAIGMRRRSGKEGKPPRLPRARKGGIFAELRQKLARWAKDNIDDLLTEEDPPNIPDSLNDRAVDNWLALLTVADLVGGDWPQRARNAAKYLSSDDEGDGEDIGVTLLTDIRGYFEAHPEAKHVSSEDLMFHLERLSERPWSAWGKRGKPISKNQVARLLRPFGITSSDVHDEEGKTLRGYIRSPLEDAFERYLSPDTPLQSAQVRETAAHKENSHFYRSRGNAAAHSEKMQEVPYSSRSAYLRTSNGPKGADREEGEIVEVDGFQYRRPTRASILARLKRSP